VRYLCTIFSHNPTFAGSSGFAGNSTDAETPLARLVVAAASPRDAAACAYVECVGRTRARLLRHKEGMPRSVAALEANPRAIAASLRKMKRRQGAGYLLDNLVEGWSILVDAVVPTPASPRQPRPIRLPHPLLLHFLRTPLPN
jgi:hypothetical protein